jgi:hypothetical protein
MLDFPKSSIPVYVNLVNTSTFEIQTFYETAAVVIRFTTCLVTEDSPSFV